MRLVGRAGTRRLALGEQNNAGVVPCVAESVAQVGVRIKTVDF
jgi:hypothetical protein